MLIPIGQIDGNMGAIKLNLFNDNKYLTKNRA